MNGRKEMVVVFRDEKKDVLLQRAGDAWAFVSGEMGARERPERAAVRVAEQTFGAVPQIGSYLGATKYTTEGVIVERHVFVVPLKHALERLAEHEHMKLYPLAEVKKLKLNEGDTKVLGMLEKML